jgi:hypothetical protein
VVRQIRKARGNAAGSHGLNRWLWIQMQPWADPLVRGSSWTRSLPVVTVNIHVIPLFLVNVAAGINASGPHMDNKRLAAP